MDAKKLETKQEIIEAFEEVIERLQKMDAKEGEIANAASTESLQRYHTGRSVGLYLAVEDVLCPFLDLLKYGEVIDHDAERYDDGYGDEPTVE